MLYNFNENQVNFLKIIMKSILPGPPQAKTVSDARITIWETDSREIEKMINQLGQFIGE